MPGGGHETTSDPAFASAVAAAARDASARHARWDAPTFAALVEGPARTLWESVRGQPLAAQTLAGYLSLLREAVAAGYVRGTAWAGPTSAGAAPAWRSCLEYCLVSAVPDALPRVAPEGRVELLAKVWNLGEGLLREPAWVDRYVVSRLGELGGLSGIEEFLVTVLEPVLEPAPPAQWRGPFRATVLDLRPSVDDLLPGRMTLAAPTLLTVQDRTRPTLFVNVLLRREGRSQALGASGGLPPYEQAARLPPVEFARDRVTVAGHPVPLPLLDHVHEHLVVPAGFVVASALDSQRLWIVESP
jgi:hypothetical protein